MQVAAEREVEEEVEHEEEMTAVQESQKKKTVKAKIIKVK